MRTHVIATGPAETSHSKIVAHLITYFARRGSSYPDWAHGRRNRVIRGQDEIRVPLAPNTVLQSDDHLSRFAPSVARR